MASAWLAALLAAVVVATLAVGLLGVVRIRKERPSLKSYELPPIGSMGSDSARTAAKTDAPETASALDTAESSHMRARDQDAEEDHQERDGDKASLLQRLGAMLWQLTGIPLLAGDATASPTTIDSAAMGNTAAPTRTLLSASSAKSGPVNAPEIDAVRASKAPVQDHHRWSQEEQDDAEQDRSSDEEDDSDRYYEDDDMSSQQTNDETFEQMRAHMVIDGLQFYSTVASVSVATVAHAIDIALFRATTIVLHERRKAHEDASIQAIETLYPDIMCLPPGANARYAGIKAAADAQTTVARAMAQTATTRHLETGFLKAA